MITGKILPYKSWLNDCLVCAKAHNNQSLDFNTLFIKNAKSDTEKGGDSPEKGPAASADFASVSGLTQPQN